jgi:hypothetical protein
MELAIPKGIRINATASWQAIPGIVKYAPLALAAACLPVVLGDVYLRDICTYIALYVMLGMGMNIVVGYAGLWTSATSRSTGSPPTPSPV